MNTAALPTAMALPRWRWKWLLLRRLSQVGILGLFLLGPWAGIWIVKGNLSSNLVLDLLPPLLSLDPLPTGPLTREDSVEVTGRVVDQTPVTVTVAGVAAVVTPGDPATFRATVPLVEGDNSLDVVASDAGAPAAARQ